MIVCDICKRNKTSSEQFVIPTYAKVFATRKGVKLIPFTKLGKSYVVVCKECQEKIAGFIGNLAGQAS